MLPTKGGAVVAIVGLTLFGLAWHTHIGWFYLADAVAWGLIVANLALSGVNMRGLSVRRMLLTSDPKDIFEDDVIRLAIEVGNRSFFPKLFMTVLEDCPLAAPGDAEQAFLIGSVATKGQAIVEYSVRCYRRGVYSFGPVQLETSAPFGLFRARKKLEAPFQVTVYPQLLPVAAMADQGRAESQASLFNAPHHSGDVRGSRDYQPGDYLRNIHWRNSARRGKLMVKEMDRPPQGEVYVAFSPGIDLGEGRDTTFEYGIKVAASLARRAFNEGRPFRMWPSAQPGPFPTLHSVLEYLARLNVTSSYPEHSMLGRRDHSTTSVFIVSAADKEMVAEISAKRGFLPYVTALVLEGFAVSEEDPATAGRLADAGASVVTCRPGDLANALAKLGKATAPGLATQRDYAKSPVLPLVTPGSFAP